MTQSENLEALMQKAIDGGWEYGSPELEIRGNGVYFIGDVTEIREDFATLIFNHDFAKALWGQDWACEWHGHPVGDGDSFCRHDDGRGTVTSVCGAAKSVVLQVWQYHLQQAVINDDPIGYMYGVVFG